MFVSLTRLRLRSVRFLPSFVVLAVRSQMQVKKAPGFQTGGLLADRHWTFWTMTGWDCQQSMRQYMVSGAHKTAMPHLLEWCDEASVAHWDREEAVLPTWLEADRRMRNTGRPSKVRHPSGNHASLTYDLPRSTIGGPFSPS